MMAVLATILTMIGYKALDDVVAHVGSKMAKQIKQFAQDIYAVMSKNSQMLADFKTANENKKSGILSALINSSGLGARAENLMKSLDQAKAEDKELTDKVVDANNKAQKAASKAEEYAQNAQGGLIGALDAKFVGANNSEINDASQYKVNDPNQNITGGLSQ